ncbi:RES domain-containing protein [Shinella sp. AETb1-6]|uniref:RES family NAD+ phosphorylase n=1 Tax=Shinella sp. AETb1-6 TaxID=2692210 RepID=UPI001369B54E|nr:RES family NAD+ phosphorylase [Shinella sp. AETb1-6]MXN53145.1 RES domain-containing protein [Shinella sp. AETb1-6]
MVHTRRSRDNALIDAIEALTPVRFEGTVWRVVRKGRSPVDCARAGGRWDDGTFDVLYTSQQRDGAIAEMYFHLGRGQPVFPSRVEYGVHELDVTVDRALQLVDLDALQRLGLDTSRYGQLSYDRAGDEYPRSQDIAEAAHFLEFDGLVVPSARWNCMNVILFCDRVPPDAMEIVADHGLIDWSGWIKANKR